MQKWEWEKRKKKVCRQNCKTYFFFVCFVLFHFTSLVSPMQHLISWMLFWSMHSFPITFWGEAAESPDSFCLKYRISWLDKAVAAATWTLFPISLWLKEWKESKEQKESFLLLWTDYSKSWSKGVLSDSSRGVSGFLCCEYGCSRKSHATSMLNC